MKRDVIKGLEVTVVNPTTQQAQRMISAYKRTRLGNSIYTAYGRPSYRKVNAFNHIESEMNFVGGYGMRITGAGSSIFTCAYILPVDNKEYLIYHTPTYRFAILLN